MGPNTIVSGGRNPKNVGESNPLAKSDKATETAASRIMQLSLQPVFWASRSG
jgi:hypothetical protein